MEAVLGATIQIVLKNVRSSISEIKRVLGEQDLSQLSSSLEMIEQYLADAEAKRGGSRAVQLWRNRLEDLAFEADAVLDEVKYELLRRQVKKQNRESNQVLGSLSSGPSKWIFKLKMAGKIKDVNAILEKTNKEATSYGLQMAVAVASKTNTSTPPERETDSFSVEPYIVGRENNVSEIVEKLITAPPEETISVIPIVGMGGVGKTTIARNVFHDEKNGNHFAEKIWVCVSFDFDSVSLFKKILVTTTQQEANVPNEVVLQKIKKHLAGKRYLLVLDDVWNEKSDKWKDFMTTLSNISDVKGNCIVVTTRKKNIASDVRTLPTHQLLGLSESQCWSIIKAETFIGMDVPGEFERIGICIAERCGGLPLAAKVVGGLLRGKSEEEWRSILENKLPHIGKEDDDKITKILRLSYDNLPSLPLKKCFAYCSVFPRDLKMRRQQLIELWMAEGFLHSDNKGNDMEAVGDNFFNHLLQHSLFQDAEEDIFGEYCKMHDLFHDLACSITMDMHQARYLAIESTTNESPTILPEQMMCLRTLFFNGKITNEVFSNFKCLHVLKLTGHGINELPPVIEKLIHLRSLDISETEIECLPDSIRKLYHLQTLWVALYLKKLPNTMIDLVSLRHVHISDSTELPPGIGKLTYLRTLSYYNVRDENGCGIGELGNLKNLKGLLKIVNLQRVKDKEEAKLANLYRKPCIVKLVFEWNESRDGERKDENVLDGLQPHRYLKYLDITGYEGKNFPSWTMRMVAHNEEALNNLIEIKLKKCTRCEELPMLGHLLRLRFLELDNLRNVQSIGPSFYGCVNFAKPKAAFPALEKLYLWSMPELTEWVDMQRTVTMFPCLKELKIIDCPKLKSLQNRFPRLNTLEIRNCTELNSVQSRFPYLVRLLIISCRKLKSLQNRFPRLNNMEIKNCTELKHVQSRFPCLVHLSISDCPKLKSLQNRFPHLNYLEIRNCTELINVCRNTSNLEVLTIVGCPELKSIPYDVRGQSQQGPTSLRILRIMKCKGLTDLPIELLNSCTSSLEELEIVGCPGLKSIPYDAKGGQSQQGLISLRILCVKECQGLTHLPIELLESCASSLEVLTIEGCPKLKSIPYDAREGQSQQGFTSLRILQIKECQGLIHLPIELLESCTSSLERLSLYRSENLENLDTLIPCVWRMPRLQRLALSRFPKLMNLPAENCCLTSLRRLYIGGLSESINLVFFNHLFHECRSLEFLFLSGNEDSDSLPNQIQHLTALQELTLLGFGIEAFPEWIGNMSSLERLHIMNCKRLRHLPSKEAVLCLTKLSQLSISGCPLLKVERCSPTQQQSTPGGVDDSEWPKISHIQEIKIDDRPLLPTRNPPEAGPSEENWGSSSSRKKVFGLCFK